MIRLGRFTLTGWRARVVLCAVASLIIGFAAWISPPLSNWPMWSSFALWVVFFFYWGSKASDTAPTKSSETSKSGALHALLLDGALLLLFIPVPGLNRRYLPASALNAPIGLAVQAAAGLLAAWARNHLGRNWSAAVRIAEGHQLIQSGPYRLVRHPIYSAMFGMFIGTAVVSGRLHALLGVALLAFAYRRKIGLEEQRLAETFGAAFQNYRRATWALVPWLF